jgi:SPP1 gp7 family putative phage head morphogenesis protein
LPVTFVKAETDDPILALAAKMAGRLRNAFLRAVKTLSDSVTAEALAEAIRTGNADQAMAILGIDRKFVDALNGKGQEANIQSFRSAIQEVFAAGAATAAESLPKSVGINLSFNLMNPETVSFLEKYTFPLIQQISAGTRDAVQEVVVRAFKEGGHPYQQARTIKSFIGLTAYQTRAVQNYRDALSSSSTLSQSLNRALRDGRFDSTIRRAARNNTGLSQDQIDKMTARYQERFLQYRATTIARSESIRAANMGQRALWKQAVSQGLLKSGTKRIWITSGDDRTCDICDDLDGETAGLDEEFDDGIMDPPDPHSDCRCTTALVF